MGRVITLFAIVALVVWLVSRIETFEHPTPAAPTGARAAAPKITHGAAWCAKTDLHIGDSPAAVLAKCGKPDHVEDHTTGNGKKQRKVGEEWTYDKQILQGRYEHVQLVMFDGTGLVCYHGGSDGDTCSYVRPWPGTR